MIRTTAQENKDIEYAYTYARKNHLLEFLEDLAVWDYETVVKWYFKNVYGYIA